MALTQYVQETRKSLLGAQPQLQPQQPAKQLPPRPLMNTPNAQLSQQTVQHVQPVQQSVDQELLPSKQAQFSQQLTSSLKHPVQERPQNVRVNPQSVTNQNVEMAEKSLPETLQKRQLPSYVYQLFEKKEVLEVFISYVSHRFSCLVFCSLSTRPTFLFLLLTVLTWLNTVFKCQFLIHIFFYLCLGTHFLQESRSTTEGLNLVFWLRCVLLPWQWGWLKTRLKKWFCLFKTIQLFDFFHHFPTTNSYKKSLLSTLL